MRYFRVLAALLAFGLSACVTTQRPLNPPVLVTARDTDMAIQLFMQATILLGRYYDFNTLEYDELRDRSVRRGYDTLPFMPPIAHRVTPRFVQKSLPSNRDFDIKRTGAKFREWANKNGGQRMLVAYYISTGHRAAQLVCRNYLVGLEERNEYLEFLQREFNIGASLANMSLIAAGANVTLRAIGVATQWVGNEAIDSYQEFRYMKILDRDVVRGMVESAQNEIANTFLADAELKKISDSPPGAFFPVGASPFSVALQAVSLIEHQCTRSGIRGLVNKAGLAVAEKRGKMTFNINTNQIEFVREVVVVNPK
jgi:hypothetical protein